MGLIISRFRKKLSSKEQLEQIQKDVAAIEEYGLHTQQRQKRLVGCLVLYSIVLYLVAAIVCYFYYFPTDLNHQLLYSTPFIVFPVLVYTVKRLLTWYYRRKISRNEEKLKELKKRKEKILEQVMETETYKVAKELLELYGTDPYSHSQLQMHKGTMGAVSQRLPTPAATPAQHPDVRRRIIGTPQTGAGGGPGIRVGGPSGLTHQTPAFTPRPSITVQSTPATARPPLGGNMRSAGPTPGPLVSAASQVPAATTAATAATPMPPLHTPLPRAGGPPGPPMPRPVLPRERGILDRFVEYLVGDGPANRFALVCRQCESHNGMALKDEFQYLAFRCAYCFYWNPARKQRPAAPRLETLAPPLPPTQDQEEEEEEQESSSGEEEEEEGGEEGSLEDLAKSTPSSELTTATSDQTTSSDQTASSDQMPSSDQTSDEQKKGCDNPPADAPSTAATTSSSTTPSSATETEETE